MARGESIGGTTVDSPENLARALEILQRRGEMPIIVSVHAGKPPFNQLASTGEFGGVSEGLGHAVTIRSFQNGRIELVNQWGRSQDKVLSRSLTVEEVFAALDSPFNVTRDTDE
jgi:hypothetical protein